MYAVLKKTGTLEQAIFKGVLPLPQMREKFGSIMDSIHYMPMVHSSDYNDANLITGFYDHYRPAGFELVFSTTTGPVVTSVLPAIKAKATTVWVNALWASQCAAHDDEKAMTDPDANWGWLIKLGANVIQTDRPRELLAYLQKKGYRNGQ
jgi:glycerophosphoryl diester phosphodiesterase